jgi:hypothetical protein
LSEAEKRKDIIIFTGQSGMDVKECLNRLNQRENLSRHEPIDVEREMEKSSGEDFAGELLRAPPKAQEKMWRQTLKRVQGDMETSDDDEYVFLSFHASYYHPSKTEFACAADLGALAELRDRTKMVIVLVDDCYNIYKRLMAPGKMFHKVTEEKDDRGESVDPLDALLKSIWNLSTILTWREVEIAFSRKIATFLDVPFYVIAVRHPTPVFSRLIKGSSRGSQGDIKLLYLAHSISEIREAGSDRYSYFIHELSDFIRELTKHDDVVLFVPDAIDEKRIKKDGRGRFLPETLDGWQLPFHNDEMLFVPLETSVRKIPPLNPRSYEFGRASDQICSSVSYLLADLTNRITQQINSRDRTLVEQSEDGLVVYRPYPDGAYPSAGVDREIEYSSILRDEYSDDYSGTRRKVILLSTAEDLGRLRITMAFDKLRYNVGGLGNAWGSFEDEKQRWQNDLSLVDQFFQGTWDLSAVRNQLEPMLLANWKDYVFDSDFVSQEESSLQGEDIDKKFDNRERGWKAIRRAVVTSTPYDEKVKKTDLYMFVHQGELTQAMKDVADVAAGQSSEGAK